MNNKFLNQANKIYLKVQLQELKLKLFLIKVEWKQLRIKNLIKLMSTRIMQEELKVKLLKINNLIN